MTFIGWKNNISIDKIRPRLLILRLYDYMNERHKQSSTIIGTNMSNYLKLC